MPDSPRILRLGTRGSLLAKAQSHLIANDLRRIHPNLQIQLHLIKTTGDRITDRPLAEIGGKGLFVKEIEQALLDNQIDIAVHSCKDLPVTMPLVDESNLLIAAVPTREDPADVAVLLHPTAGPLPATALIGTSSLRRRCQLLELYPQARITPLRGNIDTRIRKLREGEFDAIILAAAGLKRAGLFDPAFMQPINLLPAAGQGALALQCRSDDSFAREILAMLDDPHTHACIDAERALVHQLKGDCHSPIAALATVSPSGEVRFQALVGGAGGQLPLLRAQTHLHSQNPPADLQMLQNRVFEQLMAQGAFMLLHGQ